MTLTRRALLATGAALPFLRQPAHAAVSPGKLVFGLSSYPPSMAPWANAGTAAATVKLMFHRGLLGYGPDGVMRGELAETWEHAEDGAWVFHLRNAVFHNGAPVTSADVAWTIEQVAGEKSTAYLRAEMQRLARVETPDAKTVRFYSKEPNATLPLILASHFMPILAKGSTTDQPLGIGAGPFILTSEERGVALEFKAFDKFYRPGLPRLKTVRMVAYADENLRVAALQSGDVDLIEYVPWQSMASIEADPKLSLQTTSGPFMYITFNAKAGPFADARVRRAVAHAIKREEIIKAAFFGRGAPIEGFPLAKGTTFYNETLAHDLAYDPAKTKALLSEAGMPNGFSCKLLATAQYGMHKDTAAVTQQHLAAVGIQAELVLPDWATRITLGNRGQFELAVMGTGPDSNDPDSLSSFYDGRLAASYVRSYALDSPALDKLIDAGRAEFDTAKRQAIYTDLQKVYLQEVPMIGLCFRAQGYGMSRQVHDFHNMPGALTFFSGTTFETTTTG
jgi:ABC-type transport system substrate-binding protein